jgi:hypothetical protein
LLQLQTGQDPTPLAFASDPPHKGEGYSWLDLVSASPTAMMEASSPGRG